MIRLLSDGLVRTTKKGDGTVNEFIPLTKQQIMDLQTAKKKIADTSNKDPKTKYYLNVDDDGEVEISKTFIKDASGLCYRNGSEIALPVEAMDIPVPKEKGKRRQTLQEIGEELGVVNKKSSKQTVATETATNMAKKNAKKAPAKKATAKKSSADWGKKVDISIKDMRAGIKNGFQYRDPQGIIQSEAYMATRARQDHVREGMYVAKIEKA